MSMNDEYLPKCKVLAVAGWAFVLGLLVAAWLVMLLSDDWRIGVMLAVSACASSAVAATLHIRSFQVEMAALVRLVLHAKPGDDGQPPNVRMMR